MGTIQLMSTSLANQIAAGEVVTRPASCVKELIENSLDAGAKRITVTLAEGGIAGIVIKDDGVGMDEFDASLAFARHATSKVYDERDLTRIRTLGFRGEALASIAAVSRVSLTTRTRENEHATLLQVDGGDMGSVSHVGGAPGTRIEVRDLFYNTPARLKYMRTVQTEQARAVEVVQKAALSRPDVAFTCETDHHILFQTPGTGDVRAVLAALYGIGEAKQLLSLSETTPDYKMTGYVGRPTQGRASRAHAHLFVNHRPVRNIAVHQAVIHGYKNRLMVGKQPMYAIFIEMDPTLVDVNVHPHKQEVRFSEEPDIVRLVTRAVARALDDTLLAPSPVEGQKESSAPSKLATTKSEVQPLELGWESQEPVLKEPLSEQMDEEKSPGDSRRFFHPGTGPHEQRQPVHSHQAKAPQHPITSKERAALYEHREIQHDQGPGTEEIAASAAPVESDVSTKKKEDWNLRPIGQALGMYVLADDGESLYVIDQHAAHERVLFESFYDKLTTHKVLQMPLTAPLTVTLTPSAFTNVMKHQDKLAALGLTFDHFGAYDIVVRTVPDIWDGLDIHQLAQDVVQNIPETMDANHFFEAIYDVIATRACKAAVKANWHLSTEEMEALCRALPKLKDPFHCPHGRPIFLRLTDKQLEKEFRRIV